MKEFEKLNRIGEGTYGIVCESVGRPGRVLLTSSPVPSHDDQARRHREPLNPRCRASTGFGRRRRPAAARGVRYSAIAGRGRGGRQNPAVQTSMAVGEIPSQPQMQRAGCAPGASACRWALPVPPKRPGKTRGPGFCARREGSAPRSCWDPGRRELSPPPAP